MAKKTMTKLELAQRQLETAIGLFVSRRDRISAITLAGAADGILHGLVLKAGKQPFADYAMGVTKALSGALVHESELARNEPDAQVHHLPRAYDDGLPSSAIRLRM